VQGTSYAHLRLLHRPRPRPGGGQAPAGLEGGQARGPWPPITELGTLRDENADVRRRLLEGELLPNVAAVAVQSINTVIRAVGAALKAREQEELTERLQILEERLEQRKGERRYGGA
jgi:hypothetical protein